MTSDPTLAPDAVDPAAPSSPAAEAGAETGVEVCVEANTPPADAPPRRVTLNPTGGNELRAIPSIDVTRVDRDIDAEAEREARRVRERDTDDVRPHGSIALPANVHLDSALEAEI